VVRACLADETPALSSPAERGSDKSCPAMFFVCLYAPEACTVVVGFQGRVQAILYFTGGRCGFFGAEMIDGGFVRAVLFLSLTLSHYLSLPFRLWGKADG